MRYRVQILAESGVYETWHGGDQDACKKFESQHPGEGYVVFRGGCPKWLSYSEYMELKAAGMGPLEIQIVDRAVGRLVYGVKEDVPIKG